MVTINGENFNTEFLVTDEQKKKGLMGRDNINGCAVFVMKPGYHSFWMKNCIIPLDIVFVNKNKISKIHLNCPPINKNDKPISYTGYGDYVIEFPSNTAKEWNVGDSVIISK